MNCVSRRSAIFAGVAAIIGAICPSMAINPFAVRVGWKLRSGGPSRSRIFASGELAEQFVDMHPERWDEWESFSICWVDPSAAWKNLPASEFKVVSV